LAQTEYAIRGRIIGAVELETIKQHIRVHWEAGRSAVSRRLCEHWDWRQANGRLKERACRVLLLKLEEKGEIVLPPRLKESFRHPRRTDRQHFAYDTAPIDGKIGDYRFLTIKMVRQTPDEALWDHLVDKYHYLGNPWIVGAYLKHIAYLDGNPAACLGWGSAAWKVACRDDLIGWTHEARQKSLHKIVNNVRFLILPWVQIKHLASKVLAANVKIIAADWQSFYNHDIALLETFVDTTRFKGICYRAANWQCIGQTKGRGKYDQNEYAKPIKDVFLYPLAKDFKQALHG
jgi:hypothetical protein